MLHRTSLAAGAAAWLWAASAAADPAQYCPKTDICFGVAVPDSTASAGSGNIYFQISAPSSYSWVALGTGTGMSGANIFVMYQDGSGNLTLSPRLGTGHSAPTEDTSSGAAQLTLLAGSGVAGDTMVANVRCANCESWGTSGALSVTSTSSSWIAAWKAGSSLATTDKNAALRQHDAHAQYALDLTQATVAADANPFVASGSSTAAPSPSATAGTGTGSGSGPGSGSGSGSGSTSGSGTTAGNSGNGVTAIGGSGPSTAALLVAHGAIMGAVMVVLYPLGSALMPLLGKWLLHGVWQGLAYALMWVGFALGVVVAHKYDMLFSGTATTHTTLGTVVVAAFGIQPLLGFLHHRHFVQHQRRGAISHLHIWWGRVLMVLGIVNGGIGLHISDAPRRAIVGYSVASVVLSLAYVAAKTLGSRGAKPARTRLRSAAAGPDVLHGQPARGYAPSQQRDHKSSASASSRRYSHSNEASAAPSMREAPADEHHARATREQRRHR